MAKKPEEFAEPVGPRGLLRVDGGVPVGLHDPVPAVDDRRRCRPSVARTGLPDRQALQVRPRSRGSPTATTCTSGTTHRADGRWRIYAFADAAAAGEPSALGGLGGVDGDSPESPIAGVHARRRRPRLRARRQGRLPAAPRGDRPRPRAGGLPARGSARSALIDYEKVYAAAPDDGHLRAARHRPRAGASSSCGPTSTSRPSCRSPRRTSSPSSSRSSCVPAIRRREPASRSRETDRPPCTVARPSVYAAYIA